VAWCLGGARLSLEHRRMGSCMHVRPWRGYCGGSGGVSAARAHDGMARCHGKAKPQPWAPEHTHAHSDRMARPWWRREWYGGSGACRGVPKGDIDILARMAKATLARVGPGIPGLRHCPTERARHGRARERRHRLRATAATARLLQAAYKRGTGCDTSGV